MNHNINLNKLLELPVQSSLQLEKDHIPRKEQCPLCKVHLIEDVYLESDAPKSIVIGKRYNSWYRSNDIYCPNCKMTFKHPPTERDTINEYLSIVEEGPIYKLELLDDFKVSRYGTEIKKDIKKGAVVYASRARVSLTEGKTFYLFNTRARNIFDRQKMRIPTANFMWELKKEYHPSESMKKVKFGVTKDMSIETKMRDLEKYQRILGLECALSPEKLIAGTTIMLPASLFNYPKK
jgi:hypothetical protein